MHPLELIMKAPSMDWLLLESIVETDVKTVTFSCK